MRNTLALRRAKSKQQRIYESVMDSLSPMVKKYILNELSPATYKSAAQKARSYKDEFLADKFEKAAKNAASPIIHFPNSNEYEGGNIVIEIVKDDKYNPDETDLTNTKIDWDDVFTTEALNKTPIKINPSPYAGLIFVGISWLAFDWNYGIDIQDNVSPAVPLLFLVFATMDNQWRIYDSGWVDPDEEGHIIHFEDGSEAIHYFDRKNSQNIVKALQSRLINLDFSWRNLYDRGEDKWLK